MVENNENMAIKEEEIEKIWKFIRPFLTKESLERLSNLRIAHTEKWLSAILIIYQYVQKMLMSGRSIKIDERTLKILLSNLFKEEKRRTRIRFIH